MYVCVCESLSLSVFIISALSSLSPFSALGKKTQERERKALWDDRHWTDKSLDEMADRDWRILKEDFSIATKGGRIPNPVRSWEEANLPGKLLGIIEDLKYDVHAQYILNIIFVWDTCVRNRHRYRGRPFQSDFKTEMSLVWQRQV